MRDEANELVVWMLLRDGNFATAIQQFEWACNWCQQSGIDERSDVRAEVRPPAHRPGSRRRVPDHARLTRAAKCSDEPVCPGDSVIVELEDVERPPRPGDYILTTRFHRLIIYRVETEAMTHDCFVVKSILTDDDIERILEERMQARLEAAAAGAQPDEPHIWLQRDDSLLNR